MSAAILAPFDIDLATGRLFWNSPPKNHPRLKGQEAGCARPNHNGKLYWVIRINKHSYKRAHLVFMAVHGRWPKPCIDHINGNSADDRPANLREATVTQNAWNRKGRKRRILLPMGVRLIPASGRYQARITINKKMLHLGAFDTPEEARAIYLAKRKELFGEYSGV